jgi:hypothetical protein
MRATRCSMFCAPGLEACAAVDDKPVAICTVTVPVALEDTVSLVGLNLHAELDGSEPQLKVKVAVVPLVVARLMAKVAVCPLEIVWLD